MRRTTKWKVAGLGLAVALAPSAAAPPVRAALNWTARQADDEALKLRRLFAHVGATTTPTAPLSSPQPTGTNATPRSAKVASATTRPHAPAAPSVTIDVEALRAVFAEGIRRSQPDPRLVSALAITVPAGESDLGLPVRPWVDALGAPVFIAAGAEVHEPASPATFRAAALVQPSLARVAAEPTTAPEPSPVVLLSTGLLAIMGLRVIRAGV